MSTSRLVRASAVVGAGMLFVMGVPGTAAAQAPPELNGADTAWMLISTALVLLMTPALAFFYGGLVRSKNALNTMMMSFISLGFVGVLWAVVGYSLAFTAGQQLDRRHLARCSCAASGSSRRAPSRTCLFMAYQGTFCIITAALISGAIVERMRFSAYVVFICAVGARRLQPGRALGVGRRLAGRHGRARLRRRHRRARERRRRRAGRRDRRRQAAATIQSSSLLPHNVPFTLLGAGLLWFGWFGFNAGSALAASPHRRRWRSPRRCWRRRARWSSGRSSTASRQAKPTAVGAATAIVVGLVADHAGGRLRRPDERRSPSARIAAVPSYFGADLARQDVARRLARRRRRARRRRHGRRAADRRVRAEGAERHRRRRAVRQSRAARHPGHRGRARRSSTAASSASSC